MIGSLAHGDPLAEWLSLFLLFDGSVGLSSAEGARVVPSSDWLEGYLLTAAGEDEFVEEASLRLPGDGEGSAFVEVAHRHGDFCLVSAAASVSLDERGAIAEARLVIAGLRPVPFRAGPLEERLKGEPATAEFFERALDALPGEAAPEDLHATAAYRRHAAGVVAVRALVTAAGRAGSKAA